MGRQANEKPGPEITSPKEPSNFQGRRLKLQRINSKDKLNNAFISNCANNDRKNMSKLPRVVKTPLRSKNSGKSCGHLDDSGDSSAESSQLKCSQIQVNKQIAGHNLEKIKGSHIPRRKAVIKPINTTTFANETQHIQRLHVPNITPDFHQEDHIPTTSIGSTRPIPTLGQIYRQNNIIIDGDRFYDWFMELDAPVNSLESNPRNTRQRLATDSTDTAQSFVNDEVSKPCFGDREKPQIVFGANVFKTTNDNISDWLANEVNSSSKDNESGYRSMSPQSRGAITIRSKHSDPIAKHSDDNQSISLGKTSEQFEAELRGLEEASCNNIGNRSMSPHSRGAITMLSKHSDAIAKHSDDNHSLCLGKTSERLKAESRGPEEASGNNIGNRSMSPHSRGAITILSKHSDVIENHSDDNHCLCLGKTSERLEAELQEPGEASSNNIGNRSMSPHSRGAITMLSKHSDAIAKHSDDNHSLCLGKTSECLKAELRGSGEASGNNIGNRSMSPHSRGAITIRSKRSGAVVKHSDENYSLDLGKTSERFEAETRGPGETSGNIDMPLIKQPSVFISKINEENEIQPLPMKTSAKKIDIALEPILICKSELSKNMQFPSVTRSKIETQAPSYVECSSEVLQKTTNFEVDGCESPNTLSSLAGTDLEIRDDYMSQFTLENVDDCNLEDHPGHTLWCSGCRSSSCITFIKSGESDETTLHNSNCACRGDSHEGNTASVIDSENHVHRDKRFYCHSCGRLAYRPRSYDRAYCKKHSRYRRFPSNRYRISRPFDSLRKRLSFKRICRHRWNNVWKKTAAKWTNWSKSHPKLGKLDMLAYLQSSIIWEDIDVQTTTLVYKEMGTHTVTMEQKSTGISTSVKFSASSKTTDTGGAGTSARSFKSRFKHINLGPSRFPFFYNSKRKSMPAKSVEEASKPVQKFYSYPEYCNKQNEHTDADNSAEKSTSSKDIKNSENQSQNVTCYTASMKTSPIKIQQSKRSVICACSANIDNYPMNKPKNNRTVFCECQTDSKYLMNNEQKRRSVISECPTNADINLMVLHKLKTIDNHTGTDNIETNSPMGPHRSVFSKTNGSIKHIDGSTQVLLSYNNIETATSFAPMLSCNRSVENDDKCLPSYRPIGINTDSFKLELTRSHQVEHNSVQLMTSRVHYSNEASDSGSTTPKATSKKNEIIKMSTSSQTQDNNTKADLAMVTSSPKLFSTDANITSISSAQMLPASTVTSPTDLNLTDANITSISSAQILPASAVPSPTDLSLTGSLRLQENKSIDYSMTEKKDKSIDACPQIKGSLHEKYTSTHREEIKQSQNLSTQALLNQWCQSQVFAETGTTPSIYKKSTYGFTTINQKSAYAVTSINRTQSVEMVTSNEEDIFHPQLVSMSTSTSVRTAGTETKCFGHSSPDIFTTQPDRKPTIDTWVQYSQHNFEQNGNHSLRSARIGLSRLITTRTLNDSTFIDRETEPLLHPSQYKSMSVMTSRPFHEATDTSGTHEGRQILICACAQVGCDMETNTQSDFQVKKNTECSTQVFRNECNQSIDKATCSSYGEHLETATSHTRSRNKRSPADQLKSLSRLIGQVQSSSQITRSPQSITSTILSSNLDADKWIKRCTQEKDYQSLIDIEQTALENLKQASISIANSIKSTKLSEKINPNASSKIKPKPSCNLNNTVSTASRIAVPTLSDDSLADVLPTGVLMKTTIPAATENKRKADKQTSDEVILKPLKESILQTCPDICDAAIDTSVSNLHRVKSASALTSRCVLPSPSLCRLTNQDATDCLFVYNKPRCAVHQTRFDASVQIPIIHKKSDNLDKKSESHKHTIDQIEDGATPCLKDSSTQRRKTSNNVIGEVLSPKVYKALYETTKMIVRESKLRPVDSAVRSLLDKENEAAIIRALAVRSAAILTSSCGLSHDNCHCKKSVPSTNQSEYAFAYNTPQTSLEGATQTQTCSNCHAKILEIPPSYYVSEFLEEHVRTQLVGSCRYYSNLLSKRFGSVKEKVTKHLAPPNEQCMYVSTVPKLLYTEACTMKPSGREHLGCQTLKDHIPTGIRPNITRPMSCCDISPSLTDISGAVERNHLKSVYYMLSAIEGRIRRLNRNLPN